MRVLVALFVFIFHVSAKTVPSRSGIIGGIEAKPNALPWVVVLLNEGRSHCGGTIICPRFVITAGHCVQDSPENLKIVAGVHDWSKDEPTQSHHKVKAFHVHPMCIPGYSMCKPGKDRRDYALIELADPINMRPEARAAFLPDGNESFQSVPRFIASGWGKRNLTDNEGSEVLRSVTIPWVPDIECHKAYPETEDVICAGDFETGAIGGCQGDSGSPLSFLDPRKDQVKIVGLTSFGKEVCVTPQYPGVYSDIAKQLKWVEGIIGECNKETCASGWCTTKDDLDPWTIEQFSRITPH